MMRVNLYLSDENRTANREERTCLAGLDFILRKTRTMRKSALKRKRHTHKAEALSTEWKTMAISIADSPWHASPDVRVRLDAGVNVPPMPDFTFTLSTFKCLWTNKLSLRFHTERENVFYEKYLLARKLSLWGFSLLRNSNTYLNFPITLER